MTDFAEQALQQGCYYYQALEGFRQSMVNLTAAELYHLFEQQLLLFHGTQVLHP
jgi:hypothetical protein